MSGTRGTWLVQGSGEVLTHLLGLLAGEPRRPTLLSRPAPGRPGVLSVRLLPDEARALQTLLAGRVVVEHDAPLVPPSPLPAPPVFPFPFPLP